jgi:hypothetical protein
MAGNMAAESDGGVWSSTTYENDTLTITPNSRWNAAQAGEFTIDVDDLAGNSLATLSLNYTIKLQLSNFQAASVVIGQNNFSGMFGNQGGGAEANTISSPYGNPEYANSILYLPEYGNNRVLGFNGVPEISNANADFVLGQTDFTDDTSGSGASEMDGPQTVVFHDGKLLLDDYNNNRVLIYNTAPIAGPAAADLVVGQTGFGLSVSDCTAVNLNYPESIEAVDNKLIVADTLNNRVLIWNSIPTSNGVAADMVLGQDSFTNCTLNDDNQDGSSDVSPSNRTLNVPTGVWSDGTRLVVIDSDNYRVLIWNTFPTGNFAPADIVIGQSDFVHSTENDDDQDGSIDATSSSRTFGYPYNGITSNGTQLFIADNNNHRIMIWNTFPTANFAPADVVLGQSDFTHSTRNDDDQDDSADTQASARTLYLPSGILIVGNKLIVADQENHRYLIYEGL